MSSPNETFEASWAKACAANERKLTEREALGDKLPAPRLVSHIAVFTNPKSCEAATAYFASHGFETRVTAHVGGLALTFERHDSLRRPDVENLAHDIVLVTSALGGRYFGWTATYVLGMQPHPKLAQQ